MKYPIFFLLASAVALLGQDGPAGEAAAIDLTARRQSVVTLQDHIGLREKRLEEVRAELRGRGAKLDARIDELVGMLTRLKDSESSKRRISELKGQAIGGLRGMIRVFQRERAEIVERLRTGRAGAVGDFERDIQAIDAAVETRVREIVDLVKSMPGGEDIEKYERDGETYFNGVVYENSRISSDWRQNRRDRIESDKARRELQEALKKAISDLERRQRLAREDLEKRQMTEAERQIQQEELAHVSSVLDQRKAQLLEVTLPSDAAGEDASKGEADDLRRMLGDARKDVAAEFSAVLYLYHQVVDEREKIHSLKENLEARKRWLEENDPAAKRGE